MFERKILRAIFGLVQERGCWRTRYNFELYRLYRQPQAIQLIRSNRLRWLGHVWRCLENMDIKSFTFKNTDGQRVRGRPPTRWLNNIESDLNILKIKNWRRVAMDRERWKECI